MTEVVAALIIKDGKILLTKRAKGNLAYFWEFPGGKIEKGESEVDALTREIKEELGVEIKILVQMKEFTHKYDFDTIKLHLWNCRILKQGKIRLSSAHNNYKWITIDKLFSLNLAPMDRKIAKYLENILNFG